jgi:UDP-3-O-[3-hydroxymyristoyl] glucosamine N-acyltransferase
VVSRDVKLGEATILNVGALIDHHVEIGYGCHILMGAVVRNKAKVEPLTRVESLSLIQ